MSCEYKISIPKNDSLSKVGLADYGKLMKMNARAKKIIASLPNGWEMSDAETEC